ncbi:hypothetical protein OSTOST_07586 [Ostertagia ostertagi]
MDWCKILATNRNREDWNQIDGVRLRRRLDTYPRFADAQDVIRTTANGTVKIYIACHNVRTLSSDALTDVYIQETRKVKADVIGVYAPTSQHDDEEVEQFYEEINEALRIPSTYTIVQGDMNASVGKKTENDGREMGKFGYGERNERGEQMINFSTSNRLRIMNTFFMKPEKRLWTWKSPNGTVKKQIDYVFSNVQRIFQDVSVIGENIIATNSDHRMIRSTIIIDNALESRILARSRRIGSKVINPEEVEEQLKRKDLNYPRLVTIDDDYQKLIQTIKEVEAGSTRVRRQNHRLSEQTLQLLRRRAALKAQGILDEEYHHICEQARRMIVADYDNYRTRKIREAVKANKGLKKVTKEVQLKQKMPLALKDESGSRVFTRSGMTRICKSFFNKLYSSVIPIQEERCTIQPEEFQPVLTDEVEAAIAKLKNGKCPGIDGITAEMLKAGGTTLAKSLARRFTVYAQELRSMYSTSVKGRYCHSISLPCISQDNKEQCSIRSPVIMFVTRACLQLRDGGLTT